MSYISVHCNPLLQLLSRQEIVGLGFFHSGLFQNNPWPLITFSPSEIHLESSPVLSNHLPSGHTPSQYLPVEHKTVFVSAGCKYNQVNSHFHCIREGCQFSFLLKHQMTSHARKHMRRMLGKNFDRVPTQVTPCCWSCRSHEVLAPLVAELLQCQDTCTQTLRDVCLHWGMLLGSGSIPKVA